MKNTRSQRLNDPRYRGNAKVDLESQFNDGARNVKRCAELRAKHSFKKTRELFVD
jgi:hypothetical protein